MRLVVLQQLLHRQPRGWVLSRIDALRRLLASRQRRGGRVTGQLRLWLQRRHRHRGVLPREQHLEQPQRERGGGGVGGRAAVVAELAGQVPLEACSLQKSPPR